MARTTTEAKTAILNLRIRPSIKAMVEDLAKADDRSVTQYIERLIEAEHARRK